MTHIINSQAITLIIQNKRFRVEKTDSRYATVIKNLEGSEDEMLKVLENRKVKDDAVKAGFIITDTEVTYKGEKLSLSDATKVRHIFEEGLPLSHFEKYYENLEMVEQKEVRDHIWDFQSYRELPISSDGYIICYKGVKRNYYSVMGRKETVVLSGEVDSTGHILNNVGAKIAAKRNHMTTNRDISCDPPSLHLGSLNYAKEWGERVVIVKVHPKDVVSVPNDCEYQKMRVCSYEVIGDYAEEITASVLDEDDHQPIESADHIERKVVTKQRIESIERIDRYLTNKQQEGAEYVTIRQIQNIFSPVWISKQEVMDILQELEYSWKDDIVQISGFDNDEEEEDDESR